MESLYQDLQAKSLLNYKKKAEYRKELSVARDERLKQYVKELCETIELSSVEKMAAASEEGHFSCCLFECKTDDKFNDEYRTVFLLRGPSRWSNPVSFFELKNITSVDRYLAERFKPFEIYLKFDRFNKKHCVMVSWKTE